VPYAEEAVRTGHSASVDNEEETARLFEQNTKQFAAREQALSELMSGVRAQPWPRSKHAAKALRGP